MTENTTGQPAQPISSEGDEKFVTDDPTMHWSNGPGQDCNCPLCIFTKSQAPGQAYELADCPRCKAWTKPKE